MNPVLIYLRPLNTLTKQRADVRVADGPNADTYGTGGYYWDPAVSVRPKLSIELMSPEMDGKVQAGSATFEVDLAQLTGGDWRRFYWGGASVVIHCTGAMTGPTAIPDFWGYVTSAKPNFDTMKLAVTATVSSALLDRDMLTRSFTGGGGIGGDAASRGVLLPAGHGIVKNIQPVWFDRVRNIGMIDGYGGTLSVDWLGEGLNSLGAPAGAYSSYAELAAAIDNKTIPPGRWGYAIAGGDNGYAIVGLGAPATGIITVHATFTAGKIGSYMRRLLLGFAALDPARVDSVGFNNLDIIVPQPIHDWRSEQIGVRTLLEQLAQSCNATPLITFQNQVTVTRAVNGSAVAVLDRSGQTAPRVLDWQSAESLSPYYQIKGRAARPASYLSTDQVNYVDTIIDRGLYDAATVYRAGNVVWLADKSSYLYTNSTADKGHAPPQTSPYNDSYWTRLTPPVAAGAGDFKYADGTPAEALKPAAIGADPTRPNVSAGIVNQGPGAIAPAADVINGYVATGANRVVLSNFARGLQGFRPGARAITYTPYSFSGTAGTPATLLTNINLLGYYGIRNVPYAQFQGTLPVNYYIDAFWTNGPWSGDSFSSGNGYMLSVKNGDTVYFRSLMARHRCDTQFFLLIFDKNGGLVVTPVSYGGRLNGGNNGDPLNFDPVAGMYEIKDYPTAAYAMLMWRMVGTGESNPYIFFTEPAMGIVPKGQLVLPPYSDGPSDPLSDQTIANTAAGFVGQAALSMQNAVFPGQFAVDRVDQVSPNLGSFSFTEGGYTTTIRGKGMIVTASNGVRVVQIGPA